MVTVQASDSYGNTYSEQLTINLSNVNEAPTFSAGNGLNYTTIAGMEFGNAVAQQTDGKYVMAGWSDVNGTRDFAVARYNYDGSLDTTFGSGNGYVITAIGTSADEAQDITVLASGKILVQGYAFNGGSNDIAFVQYNSDGSLDTSFGAGTGKSLSGIAGDDTGYSMAVQSDGKILVGGSSGNDFLLARFNSNGTLDTTFSATGWVTTDFAGSSDVGRSLAVQGDGKIMLAGQSYNGTTYTDYALARYNSNGTLDTTLNSTGKVTIDFGTSTDIGYGVAVQADGNILVTGFTNVNGTSDIGTIRLTSAGVLDTTFGGTGKVITTIGSSSDFGNDVKVQADGKILVSGYANVSSNDFIVVRYNSDGNLDTTFNSTGKVVTNFNATTDDRGTKMFVQADGKIVLAGSSTQGGTYDLAIARYNSDGTADKSFKPSNTLGGTVSYTENGSAVVLDSDVQILDAELSNVNNFNGASLTLARNGGASSQDVFSATGTLSTLTQGGSLVVSGTTIGTVTSNSSGSLVLTFNSNATQTLVNSAMRQIAYSNSSDAPPSNVQVNWSFNDGNSGMQGTGGALTATGSVTINITAVNDAPVTGTSGATTAYTENGVPLLVDSALTITDVDSANFSGGSLTVTISANNTSSDRLTIAPAGSMTLLGSSVYYNGTQVATFSGGVGASPLSISFNANSTPAIAQEVGRHVAYFNTSDNPSTAIRTIDFIISDGDGGTSNTSQKLLSITPIADAPVAKDDHFSLAFDGIDDYVNLGSSASLAVTNTLTMEVMVKPTAYPIASSIILNKEGEYEIGLDANGKLRWAFTNSNPGWDWHSTNYTLELNQWAHISVTYDSGIVSTYVNGNLVETFYGSGSIGDSYGAMNDLRVGGRTNNPAGQYFAGEIDDVRIWSVARTQSEIRTTIDQVLVGNESGLSGYWRFNEGDGSTTSDLSVNASEGTLVDGGSGTTGPQWTGYSTNQDSTLNIGAVSGLLGNDIDGDGDTLSVTQVNGNVANVGTTLTLTSGASLNVTATGSFNYNPNGAFNYLVAGATATDTFTYTITDGTGNTDTATATVIIHGSNDSPVSFADSTTAVEAGGIDNDAVGSNPTGNVLSNDNDADAVDTKTVSGVAAGSHASATGNVASSVSGAYGSITIGANGAYIYTVDNTNSTVQALRTSGQTLNDVFTYTMTDAAGATSSTQITVTVQGANDAPLGTDVTLTINEDALLSLSAANFGFTDIDSGDAMTAVRIDTLPSAGTLTLNGSGVVNIGQVISIADINAGNLVFSPANNANGNNYATVVFSVADLNGAFDGTPNTVTIDVSAVNDAPTITNAVIVSLPSTNEDASSPTTSISSLLTLSGWNDVDSGALQGVAITNTTGNGTWQYSVNSGGSWTSFGTVSGANSLLLDDNAIVRYLPDGENGETAEFTFRSWDLIAGSASGTSTPSYADSTANGGTSTFSSESAIGRTVVSSVNDATVANVDTASATEAGGANNAVIGINPTGNVLTNDTDVDSGDTKTVAGVVAGATGSPNANVGASVSGDYGAITINSTGLFTYIVDNNNLAVQALRNTAHTLQDVFTYKVIDGGGLESTTQVTITIQGANDTPYNLTSTPLTIVENLADGSSVGVMTAHDFDATETFSYQLLNDADGRFAIDSGTGTITVSDYSLLNYEAATSHSIIVQVTDAAGESFNKSFNVFLTDVDEFNTGSVSDTNGTVNSVVENASIGTVVGITASASDADATTNAITYSLVSDDGGRFAVDANTGVVTVAGAIDREADGTTRNITVRATSADGSFTDQTFSIDIVDADEFDVTTPVDADTDSNFVNENAALGTTVGITGLATDTDDTDTVTYTLDDDAGGRFTIDSVSGVVTVAGAIDREAAAAYNITIRATSTDSSFSTQNFTVNIGDVDEFNTGSVSDTNGTVNSVVENASIGTVVGITASASDADATTNAITYSLASDDGGRFAVDANTGVVTVAGAIDREADGTTRNITVRATSADGSFTEQAFSINIVDADEFDVTTPVDADADSNFVNENAALGTTVGITGSASDTDDMDTVTYTLDDDAGGRFTIDSVSGVVTVAGAIDREAAAAYNITIRATSTDSSFSTQNFTVNIGDVDEFNTGSVSDTNGTVNSVVENASIGTVVGITASASDADATTNAITYSLVSDDGGRFAVDANTGVVTVAGAIDREADGTTRNITVRATSADGSFTDQTFSIDIVDADEFDVTTPVDADADSNFVNENAALGTTVGITGSASDTDDTDTVTYTLDDDAGGRFTIDSVSGVVTVAGAIDREAAAAYNITIRATSTDSSFSTQNFTVNIGDVDEFNTGSVSDTNGAVNSVVENASIGTVVGITASASDADATTNAITYSLVSNDGGRFAVDANTGVVTVAGAIDREADGTTRNITVRAASADGSFTDQAFSIEIVDVDEFDVTTPVDADADSNFVNENAALGTTVGITGLATDTDDVDTVTYTLDDDASGRFTIDSVLGVVTVAGAIDREAAAAYNITIRATSTDSSYSTQNFTVNIGDVDEFNTGSVSDTNGTFNSVVENASIGTVVGITASASDADATTNAITYSLVSDDGGRFAVDANTGVVTVAGAIDRETDGTTRNITVRATSADGSFTDQAFGINIVDADEFDVTTPIDADADSNFVNENAALGTTVGITGSASDTDDTDTVTYTLDDDAGGRFTIDSVSGVVTVAGAIDREAAAAYNITIRATSTDSSFSTQNFTVNIGDVDEFNTGSVSDTNGTVNSVVENASIGTVVGITASASDADATTNAITYSLVSNDGGRFAVDANTGVVTVAGAIDREADGTTRNITVRATSADGSFTDQAFSIDIVDADEFDVTTPVDADADSNFVNENAALGTTVGITGLATDTDDTDTVTYTLDDDASGRFTIDSVSGVVTVAGAIDREAAAAYNITIRATSTDSSYSTQNFTVNIGDVDEFNTGAVSDTNGTVNSVVENASIGTVVGITASASDADATTNAITYSLVDDDGGRFAVDANTGVVTVAGAIDREADGTTRNVTVRATSADGSFTDQTFSIDIVDADEFDVTTPVDADVATNIIAENSSNGTFVFITTTASDADATNNIVSYQLDDSAGGRFAIEANTGVVTVADSSQIDYESTTGHSITVRAISVDGSFTTQIFTISLTDVNESVVSALIDANTDSNFVTENAAFGTNVGIISFATDADGSDTVTYTLDDDAGGRFTIDSVSGVVTVAGALDREAAAAYNITIRATSTDSSFSTQNFTVNIGDVDEFNMGAVSDSNAVSDSISENAAVGTTVGITVYAQDLDATNNAISYVLIDDAGGRFSIDAQSGTVAVANSQLLNFELASSHTIVARAYSADGSFAPAVMVIAVADVNESPVANSFSFSTSNVQSLTVNRGILTGGMSDPDSDPLLVQLASGPSHGVLVLSEDGSFQYSASAGYVGEDSFTIRAYDGQLQSAPVKVSILVTLPLAIAGNGAVNGGNGSGGSFGDTNSLKAADADSTNTGTSTTINTQSNAVASMSDIVHVGQDNSKIAERAMEAQQSAGAGLLAANVATLDVAEATSIGGEQIANAQFGGLSWNPLTVSAFQLRDAGVDEGRFSSRRTSETILLEKRDMALAEQVQGQDYSSFVEPAKWTVISTGVVIWAVRIGHIITTFASTASAWVYFDPLTVIQSVRDKTSSDDHITETMFDSKRKTKHSADA